MTLPTDRLLEALAIPTLAIDAEGKIVYANPAMLRLLAWDDLGGQLLTAIVPERIRQVGGLPIAAFLAERALAPSDRTLRMPALRRDQVEIEVDCSTVPVPGADPLTLLSFERRPQSFAHGDERIGLEERESKEEQEQRYRLVFEHAPLGIFHFDARGVITACNDVFVGVIGSSRRLLIGLNMLSLPDREIVATIRGALEGRRTFFQGDYRSATGAKTTPVRVDCAPILSGENIIGGVGIVEDITERTRAEEALHALVDKEHAARRGAEEALKAREEFLSVASHELRTPMTSLRLAVENLEEIVGKGTLAEAPEALTRKALGTIGRQCRHLVRLIDELLDVSRIEAGRFELNAEEGDLAQVVRGAIGRLEAQTASAGCTVRLSAQPARGTFDPSRIEQVATNLLSNAIKFGAGKPVEVEVGTAGGELRLSVRDHGIGIAPVEQARIFERFERAVSLRHYGGLGLGLYIVRRIVEAHGGRVAVESVPGDGARFTVWLPRVVS